MGAGAVAPGARTTVVITANGLGRGLRGLLWASRGNPGPLGWPS